MEKAFLFLLAILCLAGCNITLQASDISGMEIRSLASEDINEFGYVLDSGVLITYVDPESNAFEKGVRSSQLITAVNGEAITNSDEFAAKILDAGYNSNLTLNTTNPNQETNTLVIATTQAEKTGVERKTFFFGLGIPFLIHMDDDEVSLIHLNAIRVPKADSGKKGIMFLEMLGYMKKDNEWSVRILFITFGTRSWQP